jgi:hypothetical protein
VSKIIRSKETSQIAAVIGSKKKINGDNLDFITHETTINFRNKKRAYQKDKVYELAMNIKIKNVRDLYR